MGVYENGGGGGVGVEGCSGAVVVVGNVRTREEWRCCGVFEKEDG